MRLSLLTRFIIFLCWLSVVQAEGMEVFVAVGAGGRFARSTDGKAWTESTNVPDGSRTLSSIAYGLDRFIAAGGTFEAGTIFSSRDGAAWRKLYNASRPIGAMAYANGRFVGTAGAELLYSTDGEHFQTGQKLPWSGAADVRKVVFGDGEGGSHFVLIGIVDSADGTGWVHWRASTPDGAAYSSAIRDTLPVHDAAYGSGHFVVVGPQGLIESSHDGQNWTRRECDPAENMESVVWTGSRFLATGNRTWASKDALSWSPDARQIPGRLLWARDGLGGLAVSAEGTLFFSADLLTWQKATLPAGFLVRAIARGTAP